MSLEVMLGELGDALADAKERIGKLRAQGEADRARHGELFALLDRMDASLGEFREKLSALTGTGLADYDAVKFLNNMLRLEYRGILDYNLYAGSFADRDTRELFLRFGAMEIEHAKMLFALIRRFGGTPRPSPASTRRRIPIRELIDEHLAAENEAVALCEKGMNTFSQPDLQWALGTIRLDEIEHSRELSRIRDKHRLSTEIAEINRKYVPPKEVDFDSDEPWTE